MTDIYTQKAYAPCSADYEKIRRFTRREFSEDELFIFEVSLCDNDVDRDFEQFSDKALNELQPLFIGKTGIKNHSMKSEDQTARVFETGVWEIPGRKTADGRPYKVLRAKAYMVRSPENEALIRDIDAGIKKEVSVSCSVSERLCSICGKDKSREPCAHRPGEEYGDRLCSTVLNSVSDAYEFSFVAVPAQRGAGVEKAFEITKDSYDMENIMKKLRAGGGAVSDSEAAELVKLFRSLEDDAALGREYRKSLVKDIVKLCSRELPQMDIEVFKRLADIMTAKELVSFKQAFETQRAQREKPSPQLAVRGDGGTKNTLSEFRI